MLKTYLLTGLPGSTEKVAWDKSKPDGQPRRCLDTSRAKKEFGFEAKTSFEEGLRKTIKDYTEKTIKANNNTL